MRAGQLYIIGTVLLCTAVGWRVGYSFAWSVDEGRERRVDRFVEETTKLWRACDAYETHTAKVAGQILGQRILRPSSSATPAQLLRNEIASQEGHLRATVENAKGYLDDDILRIFKRRAQLIKLRWEHAVVRPHGSARLAEFDVQLRELRFDSVEARDHALGIRTLSVDD